MIFELMLSIGSSNFAALFAYNSLSISKFSTELQTYVFSISAQAVLSVTISSFSKRVILLLMGILLEKKWPHMFPKYSVVTF